MKLRTMHEVTILNTKLILDDTALKFYSEALRLCPTPSLKELNRAILTDYQVVWDGEYVYELADGTKISEHNLNTKIEKINTFKKKFLSREIDETTILVAKDSNFDNTLIIDGIHRAVGFYKAILEDKLVEDEVKLQAIFFESEKINQMYDYSRIFSSN